MPVALKGHGNLCKGCNRARMRDLRERRKKGRDTERRFAFGAEWLDFMRERCRGGGRHSPPRREDFDSDASFEEAISLHENRKREGGESRKSRAEYYSAMNAGKRARRVASSEKTGGGRQLAAEACLPLLSGFFVACDD